MDNLIGDVGTSLLSLRFKGEYAYLEEEFVLEYLKKSARLVRYTFMTGLFFYSLFGVLDALIAPAQRNELWLIRYGIVAPFLIFSILLTLHKPFVRYIEALGVAVMLVAGGGISVMVALAEAPANYSYYSGLILVLMLGYGMLRVRFKWACFAGWVNVLIYEIIAIFIVDTPDEILINNNFFFISANLIGMLASHTTEYYIRKNFLYSRLLKAEQKNVESFNRTLEKRVEERTVELNKLNRNLKAEIDARSRAEENIRILAQFPEGSPNPIFRAGEDGRILYANPSALDLLKHWESWTDRFLPEDLISGIQNLPGDYGRIEYQRNDRFFNILISYHRDQKAYYLFILDITDIRKSEEQLRYQAYHDDLTGLPNRVLFEDRLSQLIHYAEREKRTLAVLFLDIDNFKTLNDSLGHKTGDDYLKIISRRLSKICREEDTIARLGGDEFVILLPNINDQRRVIDIIQRIQVQLGDPLSFEKHEVIPSVSIGATFYPDDGENSQILMRNADMAMYQSKQKGKNTYSFYNREMNIQFRKRIEMEGRLKKALLNNEIRVAYQPKVSCSTLRVDGFEALVRWDSPELGMVPPRDFIEIAEENGIILELGDRVLEKALEDMKDFQAVAERELEMAVNLSARQFRDRRLVERIGGILENSGHPPELVNLEITENIVMENSDTVLEILEILYGLGVKISIDDFGTGYSSYSYLTRFRTNSLKIDKSFVDELITDSTTEAVVRNVIDLAHTLNMEAVAEGVEREDQFLLLQAAGCDLIQGYYFSRPLFKADMLHFLREYSGSLS